MTRIEHWRDPAGPVATRVAVAVFGVARNVDGAVLLVQRADSGNWEVPGGHVTPGETLTDTLSREVHEEGGVRVKATGVAGVYTDPELVLTYDTGESRQQVAIYLHCEVIGGTPRSLHPETVAAGWFTRNEIDDMPMHPVVCKRLEQVLLEPRLGHIG